MSEMEMFGGCEFSADKALRDEIMSRGDKLFTMGTYRPVMHVEWERLLGRLVNSFRG